MQQALAKLAEFAALSPRQAESLDAIPGLAPIREEVGRLMLRLTAAAQLDAELRLGHATHLVRAADSGSHLEQGIKPETAILLAGRLLEAGGYANSMRSAELSEMLINQYAVAPTVSPLPFEVPTTIPVRSADTSLGSQERIQTVADTLNSRWSRQRFSSEDSRLLCAYTAAIPRLPRLPPAAGQGRSPWLLERS